MNNTHKRKDCSFLEINLITGHFGNLFWSLFCRFGSDKLKKEFLAPSIAGDMVACLGVSEVSAGSDVASK